MESDAEEIMDDFETGDDIEWRGQSPTPRVQQSNTRTFDVYTFLAEHGVDKDRVKHEYGAKINAMWEPTLMEAIAVLQNASTTRPSPFVYCYTQFLNDMIKKYGRRRT